MMTFVLYITGGIAIVATAFAVSAKNAVHGLLSLVLSLMAVAVMFFILGAPFAAALEIIIYAGAIMVFFIFVIMMLGLGPDTERQEAAWIRSVYLGGPLFLSLLLLAEMFYLLVGGSPEAMRGASVPPKDVGVTLFGPYVAGVEIASMVLLTGLVGAYHLGKKAVRSSEDEEGS